MLAVDAGIDQRAHDAAGRGAGGGANGGRGEPARGHHGPEPRDRQQAEAGQQPGAAAQRAADASALGAAGDLVDVGVLGAHILVGDDADIGGGHARALHGIDGRPGLGVAVIDSAYGSHVLSFLSGYCCALVTTLPL